MTRECCPTQNGSGRRGSGIHSDKKSTGSSGNGRCLMEELWNNRENNYYYYYPKKTKEKRVSMLIGTKAVAQ